MKKGKGKHPEIISDVCNFDLNLLFLDSTEWKEGRNLVTPIFTIKRIKDIYPQIQSSANPFFENIEACIREGKEDAIDVKKFAKGYSLDIIGRFVFAFDLNSARDNDHPFVFNARNLTNFKLWKMMLFNILPRGLINALDLQILDERSVDYMGDLIMALVKQRRENKELRFNDFLDMLVHRIDENNLNVTNDEIISHCIIFFFAGIETVAMTVSHALYCLASYPEEQEKLYRDLKRLYPSREIEYEHLHDSDLLEAFINESQRVYPALNRLTRVAEADIKIKGVRIEKGQGVAINVYALHMDPEFWDEPTKFKPERWLEDGFKAEDENAIHFAPFGVGIRKCVAARMATVQVKYLLMKIILNYEIFKTSKTKINYMKNPMAMTFTELLLGFKKRSDS